MLKIVKKETIASVRDVYRELNAEVDRYNEGIKKSDTLEGQLQRTLTANLQTYVKVGIELADNNQITAAHLTDIGSLTEQIRTSQLDIVELAQLQKDIATEIEEKSEEQKATSDWLAGSEAKRLELIIKLNKAKAQGHGFAALELETELRQHGETEQDLILKKQIESKASIASPVPTLSIISIPNAGQFTT